MSVSIKDIARLAGVSHSTVSRALSDSPLIRAETKSRIRRLAREMCYSPDARARSLVMGRTQTVGVVVTTVADPWVAEVVQGIETTASAHSYTVILASSDDEPEHELAAVEMLRSMRVDSVIVTSSRIGALYGEYLGRSHVPVVLLNNHSEQGGAHSFSVRVDDRHGGCLATEHLITIGHRRIAHVGGPSAHLPSLERLAGYRLALAGAGIAFDPAVVWDGTSLPDAGERALNLLLAADPRPTAIFCYNDMTAVGLLRAAHDAGLALPGDLAVVGFDDIPFAALACPALTTVAQPKFAMGQQAMDMALTLMCRRPHECDGAGAPQVTGVTDNVVQGRLVVRESSGTRRR